MRLRAINVRRYPPYASLDEDSGRCRLSSLSLKAAFPKGVMSGSVVKIKLEGVASNGSITAVCTIWPDTLGCLQEGTMCLDISAVTLTKVSHKLEHDTLLDWTETSCEIVELAELRPISSIWYRSEEKLDVASFLGIAVGKDTRLHPFRSAGLVNVSRVNPPVLGIVTASTILILEDAVAETKASDSPMARTAVVQTLIDRTIQPLLSAAPPRTRINGVLLLGPPGVGKTYALRAVKALAAETVHVHLMDVSIPELLSEPNPLDWLQQRLQEAGKPLGGKSTKPTITFLLLDEVDALGSNQKQSDQQLIIKQAIIQWLDTACNRSSHACCLVGTTNRSEDVDPALRRGGRFELEIAVLSTPADRCQLLESYFPPLLEDSIVDGKARQQLVRRLAQDVAERAGGYVAADLAALVREMASRPAPTVSPDDETALFAEWHREALRAMKVVPPSCLRGLALTLPRLSFDDVIGYAHAKDAIQRVFSFFQPDMQERLAHFGLDQALGGVLLYGPPGNSKTRLVAAAAASYGLPMLTLSSADIYSAYLGEAEAEVRKAFTVARQAAPCVLFFDELDSLVTHRAQSSTASAHSTEARVLATFLNEMDGIGGAAGKKGVIVMGATNRLDCIDPALVRKGRFYQTIHIPPPTASERCALVKYFMAKHALHGDEQLAMLQGKLWEGMSGAEVENVVKDAALNTLRAL